MIITSKILFIYFINDLPEVTDLPMEIFADDTKGFNKSDNKSDQTKLQNCIDAMMEWTEKWLLKFNCHKCKALHVGKHNCQYNYTIGKGDEKLTLEKTVKEKDLGVYIDPLLTFEEHINETIKKSNNMSHLISRSITYKTKEIMVPLFKSLIRPILEYANVVWSPSKKQDINALEQVQRRFTKHMIGMSNLTYEDRLRNLNLPSLEYRRFRGDMIETFKITHNFYDQRVTGSLLKSSTNNSTRTNGYKLEKTSFNGNQYKHFFTNRVINTWNSLPGSAVCSKTINEFKTNVIDTSVNLSMKLICLFTNENFTFMTAFVIKMFNMHSSSHSILGLLNLITRLGAHPWFLR